MTDLSGGAFCKLLAKPKQEVKISHGENCALKPTNNVLSSLYFEYES